LRRGGWRRVDSPLRGDRWERPTRDGWLFAVIDAHAGAPPSVGLGFRDPDGIAARLPTPAEAAEAARHLLPPAEDGHMWAMLVPLEADRTLAVALLEMPRP